MSSSDLFIHDDSLFRYSNSSEVTFLQDAELQIFSSDVPFSPFSDSTIDILEAISDHHSNQEQETTPPSHQLQSLTLYNQQQQQLKDHHNFHLLPNNDEFSNNGFHKFSPRNDLDIKNEDFNNNFVNPFHHPPLENLCYNDGADDDQNVEKFLQRSFSIGSSIEKNGSFGFQTRFDHAALLESPPNFHNQSIGCPENNFFSSQIRRVFSTGDLQNSSMGRSSQRSFSSPLSENSLVEETNFKVGRYSAEERKERISKYRAKRTQRNFNKTIKYACRKTLADNRPRIRGRFARNDEPGEIPKAACSNIEEDEDEIWMEELHGGGDERTVRGNQYGNMYGHMQFQYCGF